MNIYEKLTHNTNYTRGRFQQVFFVHYYEISISTKKHIFRSHL